MGDWPMINPTAADVEALRRRPMFMQRFVWEHEPKWFMKGLNLTKERYEYELETRRRAEAEETLKLVHKKRKK